MRQITSRALFGGNGEYFAMSSEGHTFTVGRDGTADNFLGDVLQSASPGVVIIKNANDNLFNFFCNRFEFLYVSSEFENYLAGAHRRKFDVEVGEERVLARGLVVQIIFLNVHTFGVIAIRQEIDFAAEPHRDDVQSWIAGDRFGLLGAKVV